MISAWLLASLGVHTYWGAPLSGGTVTFNVDGQTRSAIVFQPSSPGGKKSAVYFVFHGLGGNAKAAVRQFHIQDLDPSATVIYAEGIPAPQTDPRANRVGSRSFRAGNLNTWQIMPKQYGNRDVHFVQALLKWADEHGADPQRRYYVGHSNGSGFAWVVLKELGNQFSRFVGMNGGTLLPLSGAPTKPVFLTAGTEDRLISAASVEKFADGLAAHNGCGRVTGSKVKTYPGTNPVYLYEYGGGHMPPEDAYKMAVKFCQTGKPN